MMFSKVSVFYLDDFGFEDRLWVFSGRRGLHCWIYDDNVCTLDSLNRKALVKYLSSKIEMQFKYFRESSLLKYSPLLCKIIKSQRSLGSTNWYRILDDRLSNHSNILVFRKLGNSFKAIKIWRRC